MKKKLLVLLLTSSMILMNFAPAYGAGDFTDSDNITAVENPGSSDVDAIPDMGNVVVWRGLTIENNRKDNNLHIKEL